MKFSYSLQFNTVPEWTEDYLSYGQLKKAIHEIQMQAEKLECHFDIEAMPGTKAEFIALLRTRYPKATFCSITDKAIQKHLKKLGIKFKRGVKPNKCPIFTKLTQIPDPSN